MPTYHYMLDFQVRDRELDDGEQAQIRRGDYIGDITVREDVAGFQAEDGGLGNARVAAADPEDGGGLALGARGEEFGIRLSGLGGPACVAF